MYFTSIVFPLLSIPCKSANEERLVDAAASSASRPSKRQKPAPQPIEAESVHGLDDSAERIQYIRFFRSVHTMKRHSSLSRPQRPNLLCWSEKMQVDISFWIPGR